jgi:histone H3/H4
MIIFNKNSCKRLCRAAGIQRASNDIEDIINITCNKFLKITLARLVQLILYINKKTITIDDIKFLSYVCPDHPKIALSANFNKKFIMTTKKQPKFYILYTLKGPFELMLRKLLVETCNTDDIRFEKGVVILLQHITEQYLITILTSCAIHMEQNNRDTLLVKDIESTLKILNIPFNSLIA